jgi:hypothetical protein
MAKASSSFNLKLLKGKKLKLNDYFSKEVVASRDTVLQCIPVKEGAGRKWYIAQPIKQDGEMTALLFLHLVSSKPDMKAEVAVLVKIAEMIGAELAKARELDSIRAQSVKFSAISEVSFDLAAARSLHELATIIISNVCVILEAESSILRIRNLHSGMLDVFDSFSLKSSSHLRNLETLDDRISNDVVTSREPALIKELDSRSYGFPGIEAKSAMSMYLERGGRILGTISVFDKKSLDLYASSSFSSRDKEIFTNFCLQAAKALDRFLPNDTP